MLANRTIWLDGSEFEPFLYAPVGEDRNGQIVTVLSTLARLGLDPWKEAAALAALGRDAASSRLGLLLSGFRDVPALGRDHLSVARELAGLLPALSATVRVPVEPLAVGSLMSSRRFWVVVAALFLLIQIMILGAPNSGP
jgi:hypothetical protein